MKGPDGALFDPFRVTRYKGSYTDAVWWQGIDSNDHSKVVMSHRQTPISPAMVADRGIEPRFGQLMGLLRSPER